MNKQIARCIIRKFNIPVESDFHTLAATEVVNILLAADECKYRKPKNANGSRARYFYARLMRAYNRKSNTCKL